MDHSDEHIVGVAKQLLASNVLQLVAELEVIGPERSIPVVLQVFDEELSGKTTVENLADRVESVKRLLNRFLTREHSIAPCKEAIEKWRLENPDKPSTSLLAMEGYI